MDGLINIQLYWIEIFHPPALILKWYVRTWAKIIVGHRNSFLPPMLERVNPSTLVTCKWQAGIRVAFYFETYYLSLRNSFELHKHIKRLIKIIWIIFVPGTEEKVSIVLWYLEYYVGFSMCALDKGGENLKIELYIKHYQKKITR